MKPFLIPPKNFRSAFKLYRLLSLTSRFRILNKALAAAGSNKSCEAITVTGGDCLIVGNSLYRIDVSTVHDAGRRYQHMLPSRRDKLPEASDYGRDSPLPEWFRRESPG